MIKKAAIVLCMAVFILGTSILADNNEIARAGRYWDSRSTQGMTEKAIAVLESMAKKDPNQYEVLWRLGCYYQYLGDVSLGKARMDAYKKGLAYTERAVRIKGQAVNGHLWHALLTGSIALEKPDQISPKQVSQMAGEWQLVLRLVPQNAQAHLNLARYYDGAFGKGIHDKKKAQQEASLAVKNAPDIPNGWLTLTGIALENNDLTVAKSAFAKHLDSTDPYKKFSVLLRQENQVGEDYESLWHLGYFYGLLGQNCLDKKTKISFLEKGLAYLEHAEKANSRGIAGHLYRSILLGNIGWEKGLLQCLRMVNPMVEELQTVVALEPGNAMAHAMLGQIYWKAPGKPISIGNKQKALEETALSVKYDPGSISYWFNYGKIAADNKNYTLARTAFTKVLGFFGGQPILKLQAQQELAGLPKRELL